MITYTLNLTPAAVEDIQEGLDYYNTLATDLGFRFAAEVDNSLQAIAKMPVAYGYRYKNVRAKLTDRFPYLIFFTINDSSLSIDILRIFNTYQDPFWLKDKV
jgi:toxin ParE1/3/4